MIELEIGVLIFPYILHRNIYLMILMKVFFLFFLLSMYFKALIVLIFSPVISWKLGGMSVQMIASKLLLIANWNMDCNCSGDRRVVLEELSLVFM